MEQKLKRIRRLRRTLLIVICLGVALGVVFRFFIGVSQVNGRSMMDTYTDGEWVLYSRFTGKVETGDVVNIKLPTGEYYIKRVLAMGGDTVELTDGVMYVNGIPEEGSYIRGVTKAEGVEVSYPFRVPDGFLFVVGDNREESIDSRSFGALPEGNLKGIILK